MLLKTWGLVLVDVTIMSELAAHDKAEIKACR